MRPRNTTELQGYLGLHFSTSTRSAARVEVTRRSKTAPDHGLADERPLEPLRRAYSCGFAY